MYNLPNSGWFYIGINFECSCWCWCWYWQSNKRL